MAKQLDLLSAGQVIPTALHTEMQQSYLEYAMSVIVGRALPDIRDGLKPVHRRILYAMHELGLTPDRPYRKCARVVGDVLGKYHPHGDQAVYDALVRLVQEFSTRYPLLAGHGNFGSIDNDPPAAMRYTETRLAAISHEALLSEIGEANIDFLPNFDNSQQEPVVLPAQLPFLLLNGSSGIAVGMATNVPPHNLGELVDGLIALIDHPTLSDADLFRLIPAPDFPTGGEIVSLAGVWDAYRTGRGSILVRGVAGLEQVQTAKGRRRDAIVITELPYQVNKAGWIEKVAELVNQGKIDGIADIRDESDRDGMRVVVELKREADPSQILDKLYRMSALQTTFGAIFLALVDGLPRQLSLREALQAFLQFRETTLNRRYRHELEQAGDRLHLVEGLLTALQNLDAVIDLLRHAPDGSTAEAQLQSRFDLSEQQASAILGMPLRRLTGLEQQKLQTERDELVRQMEVLEKLLQDRRELLKALKKDLRSLKRKYSDPRRTRIPQGDAAIYQEPPEPLPSAKKSVVSTKEIVDEADANHPTIANGDQERMPITDSQGADLQQSNTQEPHPQIVTSQGVDLLVGTTALDMPTLHVQAPVTSPVDASIVDEPALDPLIQPQEPDLEPPKPTRPPAKSLEKRRQTRDTGQLSLPQSPLFSLDVEPETVVEVTQGGYVRRFSPSIYEQHRRSQRHVLSQPEELMETPLANQLDLDQVDDVEASEPSSSEALQPELLFPGEPFIVRLPIVPELQPSIAEDPIIQTQRLATQTNILVITSDGRLYPVPVGSIPLVTSATNQGKPLTTLLPKAAIATTALRTFPLIPSWLTSAAEPTTTSTLPDLVLLSQQGRIKRLAMPEVTDCSSRGLTLIKLKEDDRIAYVALLQPNEQLILATSTGRLLRIANGDLPVLGRSAQSQPALRLRPDEQVIGCVATPITNHLLLVSCQSYLKSIPVEQIRLTRLGGLGMQGFQFANRSDRLLHVLAAQVQKHLLLVTSTRRFASIPVVTIVHCDRETAALQLSPGEEVVDILLTKW